MAQQAYMQHGATQVLVALDARMGEVYWGQYALQDGLMQLQGVEQVCAPADAPLPEAQLADASPALPAALTLAGPTSEVLAASGPWTFARYVRTRPAASASI